MKWPRSLVLIRHDVSAYNILKGAKGESALYRQFEELYERDPAAPETVAAAKAAAADISLGVTDQETRLANHGANAVLVGQTLREEMELPRVIFVSPYKRTRCTLERLIEGWPELGAVRVVEEERIREQEHGLATLYNDTKIFKALHPEQLAFMALHGDMSRYWYRYPQGENVPDVRDRVRSWTNTLVRDFSGRDVLAITHHLTILAVRANFERLSASEFVRLDDEEKPLNCGVTRYVGDPKLGFDGKLVLEYYNKRLY